MPYIICENCGGYYKMQENESLEDFEACQCGGSLKYAESVHELFKKNNNSMCPKCGSESTGGVFCPYCGTILDSKESSRTNKYFDFHKIEAKAPKKLFGGKNVTSTNPKDWFIRDRLRVSTDGNYFKEEVHSIFDSHESGGPGLNHSWSPHILILDIVSGNDNSFLRLLKVKKHVVAGYMIFLFTFLVLYFFLGDVGFQLSVAGALISAIITSFFANKRKYADIFLDVNILGGLYILTPVIVTILVLRYSLSGFMVNTPGNELTTIRLLLVLFLYAGMANIGGILGIIIRRR